MTLPSFNRMVNNLGGPVRKSTSCCKTFAKILLSHLGLFILVGVYAAVGACLYLTLERSEEEKRRFEKQLISLDISDSKKYIVNYVWFLNTQNLTKADYHLQVMKTLRIFHDFVVKTSSDPNINYDGHVDSWEYDWTFPKSLLFTVTSMAVIGYGHIAPKTYKGRIFTIFYNVVGIPLLLVFLANIGDFFAKSFKYIYSRVCCRWCRLRRRIAEARKGATLLEKRTLWKDSVGYETYMSTAKVEVPIAVNLSVISAYLMMGGAVFSAWEGWDLLTAVYFTLITLTTIGFGDLVPGNSFLDLEDGFMAAVKMAVTVLFCLFGMALLSMCITLMQEQLVNRTRWLLTQLGILEEDIDPMEKYKYKKTKLGTVMETRTERDGNERLQLTNVEEGESTARRPPTVVSISQEVM
ncbi:TWiK family of potassium channels protein 7-like isoform X2 [Panulirus ornatus]|uniref:TWiK family of potassium channels protein 7-like isoform X2 n=1 Tax=Panulirus ornatus TaxID=150431 RepID=UPI003A83976C